MKKILKKKVKNTAYAVRYFTNELTIYQNLPISFGSGAGGTVPCTLICNT